MRASVQRLAQDLWIWILRVPLDPLEPMVTPGGGGVVSSNVLDSRKSKIQAKSKFGASFGMINRDMQGGANMHRVGPVWV